MQKLLFILLLLALLLPAAHAEEASNEVLEPPVGFDAAREGVTYGKTLLRSYPSATTGTNRRVLILLPPDYTEDKRYPVLYLLHGIGGDENEWGGGRPTWVIGNLIAEGEAPEMIVVMPNVRARANDKANASDMYTPTHFAAFDNFINDLRDDLMPYMKANFSVAEGRENTAVAGLSMGGREALYIGLTMPEAFGYVGAFCPAPGVLPYNVEKGLFQPENFKADESLDTYILINAGKADTVVGAWPQTYADTLDANGTALTFYVTDGGHDFRVWKHGLYNFVRHVFD
ncbi:MAG: alpha/beta hydrolase [Aristaeellaceae bacterium]